MHLRPDTIEGSGEPLATISAALADLDRVEVCEQEASPTGDVARDLGLLKSVWQQYSAWVAEAERLHQDIRSKIGDAARMGGCTTELNRLARAIGRVRARLAITPEQVIKGQEQALRGEFVPANGLRDELNTRLRA